MGEIITAYGILVRKPEGKKLFEIPRCGRKGDNTMDEKEKRCEDVGWIQLAPDRVHWRALVRTIMKPLHSKGAGISLIGE
jgi:hypothetical protein